MALTTLGLLVLAQEQRDGIVSQINRKSVLLHSISVEAGAGQNLAWVAKSDGAVARWHEEGEDAGELSHDHQQQAVLPWGEYDSTFGISDLAVAAAGSSSGPAGNVAAWSSALRDQLEVMTSTQNKHLFYGTGNKRIVSLDEAIGKDDNHYATIDRSVASNAFWRPNVFDPGAATAVSREMIRGDLARITKRCGERPDLAVCSVELFQELTKMFDDKLQITLDALSTARGQVTLEGGVDAIRFGSTVFIEDKDASRTGDDAAGQIFYLNTRYLKARYLPLLDASNRSRLEQRMGTDGVRELPLGLSLKKLPDTGHAEKAMIFNKIQLQVLRPNAMGVRRNVQIG